MEEDIKYIDHKNYFEAIFTGERTFEAFINLIEKGYDKCEKNKIYKILLDICEAKGNWKEFDRFRIGEKAASFFKAPYKILVVDKKEQINKFTEDTAYNRGVNLLVTDDKKAGLDWLLKSQ